MIEGKLKMKLKTHKGMAKRVIKTKTGKWKRSAASVSHFLSKKSSRTKRAHQGLFDVKSADRKEVRKLVPYE